MPDRWGNHLQPGDAVMVQGGRGDGDVVSATVVADQGDGSYLVQLDPIGPRFLPSDLPADVVSELDQLDALKAALKAKGLDVQEPFVVEGGRLELLSWIDDDDENDENDEG